MTNDVIARLKAEAEKPFPAWDKRFALNTLGRIQTYIDTIARLTAERDVAVAKVSKLEAELEDAERGDTAMTTQEAKALAYRDRAEKERAQEMRVPDAVFELAERRTAHLAQLATDIPIKKLLADAYLQGIADGRSKETQL